MDVKMKNPIENLNKTFDNRIRLGIMSTLMVNDEVSFNELKELLNITDGNLASHLKGLEESGFIKVQKGFIGRKTNTTYAASKAGEKAFKTHLSALEQMIKSSKYFFYPYTLNFKALSNEQQNSLRCSTIIQNMV